MRYKVEDDIELALKGDFGARLRVEVFEPFMLAMNDMNKVDTKSEDGRKSLRKGHQEIQNLIVSVYVAWLSLSGVRDPELFEAAQKLTSIAVSRDAIKAFKAVWP